MTERETLTKIRQVIAELSVVSYGPTSRLGGSTPSSDDDIGGRRPPTQYDGPTPDGAKHGRKCTCEVCEFDWPGRHTSDSLTKRLSGAMNIADPAYRLSALKSILEDGDAALRLWQDGAPLPSTIWPDRDTEPAAWRRMIARDRSDTPEKIAAKYGVSRASVFRFRAEYGRAA